MKYVSLPVRLTCWFSAVFLAGFIVFGLTMWLDLSYSLSKGRDRTLARRAARVEELLKAVRNSSPAVRQARFEEFTDATPEGNLIHLYNAAGGHYFGEASTPADFPWPALTITPGDFYTDVKYSGRPFRVLTREISAGNQVFAIRIAGQLEDNRQLLARFATGLEAATPALLVVSALCGYFLSRRALGPVDRLTAAARSISIGNLSGRLPLHPTGDELQRLAETCNDMLARLESAVTRIRQFTADASHELRGPLSFIRTVTEYGLRDPDLSPETRQTFEDILAESVDAGRLLEDLLTLARADAGRMEVVLEPLDLSVLVEDVCEKMRPIAEKKSQRLAMHGKYHKPVVIRGDRSSLRRLLWTLLDNAVKYTPEEGSIEVGLEQAAFETTFTVRDSGIGIPKEALPRIFDRFYRADPSRSHAGGTGLGLAIARWIAEAHNATLTAESREGEGAVFRVAFPPETSAHAL